MFEVMICLTKNYRSTVILLKLKSVVFIKIATIYRDSVKFFNLSISHCEPLILLDIVAENSICKKIMHHIFKGKLFAIRTNLKKDQLTRLQNY
jgi:hypothetical protein